MNAIPFEVDHLFGGLRGLLAAQGVVLLAGVTGFLAAGAVAVRLQRSPIHRQRLADLTVACTLAWLVLACVPLPRLSLIGPAANDAAGQVLSRPLAISARPLLLQDAGPQDDAELAGLLTTFTAAPAPGAADPTERLSQSTTWRAVLIEAYLFGVALCAGWLVAGNLLLARLLRRADRPAPWLRALLLSLHDHLPSQRPPRLLVSRDCARPVSCGVFRPTILLPLDCAVPDNAPQLRNVLLHELAHVRQRDALGNGLFNLALPLLYFHPLYWLIRCDLHLARELVADDWAARRMGKSSYVAELVALARSHRPSHHSSPAGHLAAVGLFLFGSTTNFYRRMHMLLHRREALATRCSPAWRLGTFTGAALVLAAAASLGGVRAARAQSASDEKSADTRPVRAVTAVVRGADTAPSPFDLSMKLKDVMQRIVELNGQVRAAAEADKASEEQTYRAQLKEVEAQRELIEQELRKLNAEVEDRSSDDSRRAKEKEEAVVREVRRRRAETSASPDELDATKKQLAEMTKRVKDQQDKAMAAQRDMAARIDELRKREAQLVEAEAVAKAEKDRLKALAEREPSRGRRGVRNLGELPPADGADAGSALGGGKLPAGSLDLVALATSYADAVGNLRIAEARLEAVAEHGSGAEQRVEKTSLAAAERKARLLRSIAEIAVSGAEAEYKQARQMTDNGLLPQSKLAEAESKLKILHLILQSGGQESNGSGNKPQAK